MFQELDNEEQTQVGDENVPEAVVESTTTPETQDAEPTSEVDEAAGPAVIAPEPTEESPVAEEPKVSVIDQLRAEHQIPDSVSDELIEEYTVTQLETLNEVSTDLLLAILKGDLPFKESDLQYVAKAYRTRVDIPLAWRPMQVVEFLRTGTEPKKTSKGAWLVDETRSGRLASEWSTAELESWALGEIHAGGRTHDNGLALELKARLSLRCEDRPKAVRNAYKALSSGKITLAGAEASQPVFVDPSSDESEQLQRSKAIAAKIEIVEGLTPMNVAFIDDALARYIDAVKPGKVISEATGLKAQNDLDTMFQYVIGLEPQAMVSGLERIKPVFRQQMGKGGVFESSNVFRFTHLLRAENNRRARHVALLELMRIYFAEAKEGRQQCDARALLSHQAPEKAEMLIEYFTKRA